MHLYALRKRSGRDKHRVRAADARNGARTTLARCPGVKQVRDLAREYGVDNPRFDTDDDAKRERCILCGLCVRVCDEVVGQHAISYASRGMERVITTPFGLRLRNVSVAALAYTFARRARCTTRTSTGSGS